MSHKQETTAAENGMMKRTSRHSTFSYRVRQRLLFDNYSHLFVFVWMVSCQVHQVKDVTQKFDI